ncbi:hypothetical protein LSH36_307g02018 [Paralvinella palmiformis]|uniref:Uncharacterized protein n=1 Tax=Paralvinella palmiformis TaxID=53620 RepID=A0AAD9JHB6_9ANNE|nr:hypothetical protein LSH36_307g02018 [Paralvinella palmiformis]
MKQSKSRNTFQICPCRDSNSGGGDQWANALPTKPRRHPHTYKEDNHNITSEPKQKEFTSNKCGRNRIDYGDDDAKYRHIMMTTTITNIPETIIFDRNSDDTPNLLLA